MSSSFKEIRRSSADGIVEAVRERGAIQPVTLTRLLALLAERTLYRCHVEVAVDTGAMLKTIDNEVDALETIRRLETAPALEKGDAR